jgi:hypothetical protein
LLDFLEKAAEGPKCVGCGYCCRKAPCFLAQLGGCSTAPCSFLRASGVRWVCGLYLDAQEAHRRTIAWELAFGQGCTSSLFNTVREETIRRLKKQGT